MAAIKNAWQAPKAINTFNTKEKISHYYLIKHYIIHPRLKIPFRLKIADILEFFVIRKIVFVDCFDLRFRGGEFKAGVSSL